MIENAHGKLASHRKADPRLAESPINCAAPAPSFRELFERYSANTDGKERISEFVASLVKGQPSQVLLDLGAGDGRLTRQLCGSFEKIIAVERDSAFAPLLQQIPGTSVVVSAIQDFVPTHPFDIGLFSYSLSGLPNDSRDKSLRLLLNSRSEAGRLLFVTFQDGCAWDCFADTIYQRLEIPRSGGLSRHCEELKAAGFSPRVLATLETKIWGADVADLYMNLGFFFFKNIQGYFQRAEEIQRTLKEFVSPEKENVILSVREVIVEICPQQGSAA